MAISTRISKVTLVALPPPPKMGAGALIPGIILLLVGIGGPVLELWDRQQHPLGVQAVTVTNTHREEVGGVGSTSTSSSRSPDTARFCDFDLPGGATEDVRCPAAKGVGDEIKVYEGDNGVWETYEADWFWIVRGVVFTILGLLWLWFWLWSRAYCKRRRDERANRG